MTAQLKGWDTYVQEARREPLMLPIGDNEILTINQPVYKQLKTINEAMRTGDIFGQLKAIVGEQNAMKLEFLFDDAPLDAITALLKDITEAFGLTAAPGESNASSR